MAAQRDLHVLEGLYAVCQLAAAAPIPAGALGEGFLGISRSDEELTVVCPQNRLPPEAKAEHGWRCLCSVGPFDFALTGIPASALYPLAEAQVGIFSVSTFNTDCVLLKYRQLQRAVAALG